uniref:Uncharacterized protein n=1 Tax=Opuntia streptacantha TaxID=393608 RepID=A0A7C8YFP1_OPUST
MRTVASAPCKKITISCIHRAQFLLIHHAHFVDPCKTAVLGILLSLEFLMGFLMRIHIASQSFDHLASDQLPDSEEIYLPGASCIFSQAVLTLLAMPGSRSRGYHRRGEPAWT